MNAGERLDAGGWGLRLRRRENEHHPDPVFRFEGVRLLTPRAFVDEIESHKITDPDGEGQMRRVSLFVGLCCGTF